MGYLGYRRDSRLPCRVLYGPELFPEDFIDMPTGFCMTVRAAVVYCPRGPACFSQPNFMVSIKGFARRPSCQSAISEGSSRGISEL